MALKGSNIGQVRSPNKSGATGDGEHLKKPSVEERIFKMKKEQLANIGLTEDQISQVFALHGADIQKLKDDVASKDSELESVRGQLTQRDKDLNDLKKKGADVEDIQQKLEDLQAKYKQDTEALEMKLADENKSRLIDAELTKAGVRDAEIFEKILNKDEISVKDGKLIGLTEQIEAQRAKSPYLFNGEKQAQYTPNQGDGQGANLGNWETAMSNPDVNLTQFLEQQGENN